MGHPAFIQRSDFSAVDLDLSSVDDFLAAFDSIDVAAYDAEMATRMAARQDFCAWGIGIAMTSPHGVHLVREDPRSQRFVVITQRLRHRRWLGVIPSTSTDTQCTPPLERDAAIDQVRAYFAAVPPPP